MLINHFHVMRPGAKDKSNPERGTIDQIRSIMDQLQMDRADIREKLVKATQKKRAIELLRENRYQEWLKENKHSQQVFLDDVSQQGFIRKKRSGKKKKPSAA